MTRTPRVLSPSTSAAPVAELADGTTVVGEAAVAKVERQLAGGPSAEEVAARKREAERQAREAARRAAAEEAERLRPAEREARQARDAAWEDFAAAVAADPLAQAFLRFRDADRAWSAARVDVADANARARGRDGGGHPTPVPKFAAALAEALDEPRDRGEPVGAQAPHGVSNS